MACFRLVTFLPDPPERSVPRLRSRIARSTFCDAFLPYFAICFPFNFIGNAPQRYIVHAELMNG